MFKVNSKDTRTITTVLIVYINDFEQVNVCRVKQC